MPDWLLRAPIAHRGLHGLEDGTFALEAGGGGPPENSLIAVEAATDAGYAAEIDLRLSADGALIMIHDARLERTTHGEGLVSEHTAATLRETPLRGGDETLSTLTDVLALVSGRTPLFLDLKAPPSAAAKAAMASALTRALSRYGGAAAVMTFDPDLLAMLRPALADTPLGILAGGEGRRASLVSRFGRDALLHTARTKPDFVGYFAQALPHPFVTLQRRKRPVLAWTVRSQAEAHGIARHADQIIFEGFRPS